MSKTKVVLIMSLPRSGATVLGRILGQLDGLSYHGELDQVWRKGLSDNELCSCGTPFRVCPFWLSVLGDAFGGLTQVMAARLPERMMPWERLRHGLVLLPWYKAIRGSREEDESRGQVSRLYAALARASGAETIVDSSKNPVHAWLLNQNPDIDLYPVHLVRDSRGVAYSLTKHRRRPEVYWTPAEMKRTSPWRSAFEWNVVNAVAAGMARFNPKYQVVRYEDFALRPQQTVRQLASRLGLEEKAQGFGSANEIVLPPVHTISGNPMRFDNGPARIELDEEWRTGLAAPTSGLVTAITWPLLIAYKYALFQRAHAGLGKASAI